MFLRINFKEQYEVLIINSVTYMTYAQEAEFIEMKVFINPLPCSANAPIL